MARNERFAAARAARQLTAEQLADLVAERVRSRTGSRPPIDADHVGRIERGLITWPGKDYREAFRVELGAASDAELGFYSRRSASTRPASVDVDGQLVALTGAATVGGLGAGVLTSLSAELGGRSAPARIGQLDVDDLHRVIDGMERADHAAGGRTVTRSLALDQLTWAKDTLRNTSFHTSLVRTSWMSAVARLGRLAGFMSMDARDHQVARRCFVTALQIGAEAEDWPGRLNVLSGMVRQAVHLGDGQTALQLVTLARAGETDASATTRAVLRVLEARAYGVLGRPAEAVAAVAEAEDLYAHRRPDEDPPWLWFYDSAQLHGDTGQALYPLATEATQAEAARRLRLAVDGHAPADTRGRTFSLIKLATLQVLTLPQARDESDGQAAKAYVTAREAITAVVGLRSGRAQDYLADLGRVLRRHGTEQARELAGQVSTTLSALRRG